MPTVSVDREDLFTSLGREYTQHDFDELCFEYGLELDEWLEAGEEGEERATLKIEVPANRYDLLCFEGISLAFNIYLGRKEPPVYKVVKPEQMLTLTIEPEVAKVRPFAAGAILRNVKFTPRRYKSFISLQDKLHTNLCRYRSLVAIGTHDLAKVSGNVRYCARKPTDFKFAPLNQQNEMTAAEVMEFYSRPDSHLARYVPITEKEGLVPVFVDEKDTVLSMPPLINSDYTKISLETTDIFFDLTATDETKLEIVLNEVVAMFSEYAGNPFEIEAVEVIKGTERYTMPRMNSYKMEAPIDYLNSCLGLDLDGPGYSKLLCKMALSAEAKGNILDITMPPTRPDVLHKCDIVEEAGIAYGFNNLPRKFPGGSGLVGTPLPVNRVGDILRNEAAYAGWAEVMPLTLCSTDENFSMLRLEDDNTAVRLANPKTAEYQVVRTTLLPGLLKTVRENRNHALPMRVFECGDVCFKDLEAERQARNERHFAALYAGTSASFETPNGLLDRLMQMMRYKHLEGVRSYYLEEAEIPTFFPGRGAAIYVNKDGATKRVGSIGVLHPDVLKSFDLPFVCSYFEIDATIFMETQ